MHKKVIKVDNPVAYKGEGFLLVHADGEYGIIAKISPQSEKKGRMSCAMSFSLEGNAIFSARTQSQVKGAQGFAGTAALQPGQYKAQFTFVCDPGHEPASLTLELRRPGERIAQMLSKDDIGHIVAEKTSAPQPAGQKKLQ
jgi:hypothetical protein